MDSTGGAGCTKGSLDLQVSTDAVFGLLGAAEFRGVRVLGASGRGSDSRSRPTPPGDDDVTCVVASVAVSRTVLVDLTVRIRVCPPKIWRPVKRAPDLPFMPTAVKTLLRLTPTKHFRPTVASSTSYDTWLGSSVAPRSSGRAALATGAGGVV